MQPTVRCKESGPADKNLGEPPDRLVWSAVSGGDPRSGRRFTDLAFHVFDLDLSSCRAVIEILAPQSNFPGWCENEFAGFHYCGSSSCDEAGVAVYRANMTAAA